MKRRSIILAIALVIILLGGILSVAVDNDFGRMHTQRLYLVNDNGYTVTANLFIPNAATAEAPAPAFIVVPGGDCRLTSEARGQRSWLAAALWWPW